MKKPIIMTTLALTLLASGCTKNENTQDVNDIALERVEEKFNDTCEYSAPTGDSLTGTRAFLARCNNLPDAVYVEIENYRKSDREYKDNYLAVKYKQETIDYLLKEAKKEFSDANVYYSVKQSSVSPSLEADATFNEFLKDSDYTLIATIEVKSDDNNYKTLAENMAKSIASSGIDFRLVIAVMDSKEFGKYNEDDLSYKLVQHEIKAGGRLTNIDNELNVDWD